MYASLRGEGIDPAENERVVVLRWLFAIAVLPGTVLLLVPLVVLRATSGPGNLLEIAPVDSPWAWLGAVLCGLGIVLAIWTNTLFARFGDGTAAPWDPPQRFVVLGPYRHVRNPMILGVVALLLSEASLFRSSPLAIWAAVFFAANMVYFPWIEEPGLAERFGEPYRNYKRHVRRWVPRLRPWVPPDGSEAR